MKVSIDGPLFLGAACSSSFSGGSLGSSTVPVGCFLVSANGDCCIDLSRRDNSSVYHQPPPPSRPLTLGFCQLARQPSDAWLPDRAVFLSRLIPSKVSFIYSDSSGSVRKVQLLGWMFSEVCPLEGLRFQRETRLEPSLYFFSFRPTLAQIKVSPSEAQTLVKAKIC